MRAKKFFLLTEEKNPAIEQTMKVLSLLSKIKVQKISVIVDEINIEGEGNRDFFFASIYRPEAIVRCIKVNYREFLYGCEKAETYIIHCPNDSLALGKILSQFKKTTALMALLLIDEEPSPTTAPLNTAIEKPGPEQEDKDLEEKETRLKQKLRRARLALFLCKLLIVAGSCALITAVLLYAKGRFG